MAQYTGEENEATDVSFLVMVSDLLSKCTRVDIFIPCISF